MFDFGKLFFSENPGQKNISWHAWMAPCLLLKVGPNSVNSTPRKLKLERGYCRY